MVALKLPLFSGMVPSIDPHLLTETNAAEAVNTWLYSGALVGLPDYLLLHELENPSATIAFRIPANIDDPTYMYGSKWMEFENPDTSFVRAPVAGDAFRRYYWTSATTLPSYNTTERILAGEPAFLLGVPQSPPITGSVTGGSSETQVSRAYVVTYVTAYGEEGPASEPILLNGPEDATFRITIPAVLPDYRGGSRNVTRINLYRTIVSSAGTVTYYLVASSNATGSETTHTDTMSDATLASRTILESTAWTGPPHLEGFVAMPNGILAGWIGNELWFSEAYRPHAWPAAYSLTLDNEIVGLAVANQTLVVCTNGSPMTASGVNPASITTSKLAAIEPCLSRGSIVSSVEGVYFTSPNGLILVNPGIAENLTRQAVDRENWNRIANKAKVRAARLGSAYYAFGSGVQLAFQENMVQTDAFQMGANEGAGSGFIIDIQNTNTGVSYLQDRQTIENVMNDPWSGEVLVVRERAVYWLNQDPGHGRRPYRWRSKRFQLPSPMNFAAYKPYFYVPEGESINPSPNYDLDQVFDPDLQFGVIRVFADGRLISAQEITSSGNLHRLPSGFKAEFWQIEIEADVRFMSIQVATSVKELSLA